MEGLRWLALLPVLAIALTLGLGATADAQSSSGPPVNEAPPIVKGKPSDGKKLKATPGKWSGAPASLTYAWERCDAAGSACAPVTGNGATYQTGDADVGHRLRVLVTATNGEGKAVATSAPSAKIVPLAPKKKSAPSIGGSAADGQLLSATAGSWQGTGPLTYSYQWQSCHGTSCAPIAGATGAQYRASSADLAKKLRVTVTATNVAGSKIASSKPSAAVVPGPPVNTSAPSVAGLPTVEQTLTAEPGSWVGTGPLTYTYQWRSCNLLGECEDISGATEATYTVGPLQIANSIEVEVTAHNAVGSSSATSGSTNVIKALLPANLELPSITGLLQDGGLLAAVTGAWSGTGPLSFSYLWEQCNSAGLDCHEISGALNGTLGLLAAEVGSTVRVIVTATNDAGSTSASSEPTSLVKALLPSNAGLPTISGALQDGASLLGDVGAWTGTGPLSFSQVWELCDSSGQNCKAIEGAVASTLALISSEVGGTVRLAVTATNSAGSTTATSEPTSAIGGLLPANSTLPSISGLLQDGSSLVADVGSWSGTGPLSFSRVWELCDAAGQNCKAIEGATGSALALLTSEIGSTLRLAVTATNSAGSTTATSEPTSAIKALLPSNTGLPSIVGSLVDGQSLTGGAGAWAGSEPSFSYQWLLCNAAGAACKEISGAVGTTLGLLTSEIGSTLRLAVTATNSAGSTTATSEPTSAIKALLPSNSSLPSIAGSLLDGQTLTGAKGSWTGSEPSFSYQWLLCNAAGASCKEISGAVGTTLGLLTSEIGSTLRLAVTATNSAGATTATSEPTSAIKALLPSNSSLPSIAGSLIDGQTLTGAKGSWSGSEPSFTYQWLLCNAAGASCKEISGAVGTTLGLLTSEIGSTLRLAVTATNSAGTTTATSEPTSAIKALLPSNTSLPSIAGSLIDGQTLTGEKGSWKGSEPSFSYQWLLCNAAGASCKEISGAIGTTLGLLTSEIGSTLRLAVTATNSAGTTTATSEPTSAIKALLPANSTLPSIAGLAEDGQTLTGAKGSWTGSEPSFSYQWLLCNGSGASCKEISGAVGTTVGLLTSEIDSTVRLAVTATNSAGSTTATSAPTATILAILPKNTAVPTVAGVLQVGQTIEALTGKWSGSEPITYSYQWQTCGLGLKESECTNLAGAVQKVLKLELAQVLGLTMRVLVTATNKRGPQTAASAITIKVLGIGL
jgi:hypothetical protein